MKAVVIKLPNVAKFHLGEYTEKQSTALYNTASIIHSDVLFGAFISALEQIAPEKIEYFKKLSEEGKFAISSAFYCLDIEGKPLVYLLPKPVSLNLFQPEDIQKFDVKKFKKIEFISKGVWEKGIKPNEWFNNNAKIVMPNSKTVCLHEEVEDEQFELFRLSDEEKVHLTDLSDDNELYTRTNLEILGTDKVKVHFYFLIEDSDLSDEDKKLVEKVWELVALNGIGGERSTGCGAVEQIEYNSATDFTLKMDETDNKVLLGLAFPKSLEDYIYYQTKVRGGMNYGNENRLKAITAIQEGAIIKNAVPRVEDLSQNNKKYWKYSSCVSISLHKNFNFDS